MKNSQTHTEINAKWTNFRANTTEAYFILFGLILTARRGLTTQATAVIKQWIISVQLSLRHTSKTQTSVLNGQIFSKYSWSTLPGFTRCIHAHRHEFQTSSTTLKVMYFSGFLFFGTTFWVFCCEDGNRIRVKKNKFVCMWYIVKVYVLMQAITFPPS